jgi:Fe2+ or Zn2+ uptake regulation protein
MHELVSLSELAVVEELSEGGLRYDTDVTPHHHLYCMACGKLIDIHHDFEGLELPPH